MAIVTTGITIAFSANFLAEILNVDDTLMQRPAVEITALDSITMDYLPGSIGDWGQLECEIAFDPDTKPPLTAAAETITITYPNGTTWARLGFMTGFRYTGPFEDRMTALATIKFTGDLVVTVPPGGSAVSVEPASTVTTEWSV